MQINQLHPLFMGEIIGLDTRTPLALEAIDCVEQVMAEYAVCVIRDAVLDDDNLIAFARSFGPMELAPPGSKRIAEGLYDISNLTADGEIRPYNPDGPQPVDFERFHTDSPFNSLPTKWSFLLAHVTPPSGADTEFIDTRAVYDDLPQEMKSRIEGLEVDHDMFRALKRTGVEFENEEMRKNFPRMTHPLVRTSSNGRKALYLGWHAIDIVGWEEEDALELLDHLFEFATQNKYIYAHKWRPGDMVIWDNRCTMHSATAFERYKYKRDLRRATINESGPEVSAIEANRKASEPV
ncbi:hypothetical protein GRI89_10490 [Altererythrobacter salegens]|uniref:TauD/TfdA-like domain-containing protein n=1 Tax=Croceibacterium salegens TaxID=1737568 RepID=A0A6I4SY68_9SPHN|nr:TauD/TfdA family dioxygenase [Croceibacterium salegens]MXO59967.1 hypothetical protein [Croceibacterium salegens]